MFLTQSYASLHIERLALKLIPTSKDPNFTSILQDTTEVNWLPGSCWGGANP